MNGQTLRSFGFASFLLASVPLLAPVFAQEQSNSAAKPAPPATGGESSSPKRVWTNDDMGELHRNSAISTFSGSANKPANAHEKPASSANGKDAKRYQDQIAALRAKLPKLDDRISELQRVLDGDTVNPTRNTGGTRIDDWHGELLKLQKQRDDVATAISSLQDQARHSGIPENQIP